MISVRVEGVGGIIANLQKAIRAETEKMNKRLSAAGDVANAHIHNQASLTDHTLQQLKEMGHPYSVRYQTNYGPHHDDTLVHQQTGLLYANIQKVENLGYDASEVQIGVSADTVPYIDDLIHGNSAMRPRNFLGKGFELSKEDVQGTLDGTDQTI